jgi:hypothetical protein
MKSMNYLNLNSTKRILQIVASNNGIYTWYNIVKSVDQMDGVEKVPPTYAVLKELTRLTYLQVNPPDGGNFAKYSITESGYEVLNQVRNSGFTEQTEAGLSETPYELQ